MIAIRISEDVTAFLVFVRSLFDEATDAFFLSIASWKLGQIHDIIYKAKRASHLTNIGFLYCALFQKYLAG